MWGNPDLLSSISAQALTPKQAGFGVEGTLVETAMQVRELAASGERGLEARSIR